MPDIDILQALLNGGPALLCLVGIVLVWRTWRAERGQHREDIIAIRKALEETQCKRVEDAERWAGKFCELAEQTERSVSELSKVAELLQRLLPTGRTDG